MDSLPRSSTVPVWTSAHIWSEYEKSENDQESVTVFEEHVSESCYRSGNARLGGVPGTKCVKIGSVPDMETFNYQRFAMHGSVQAPNYNVLV